MLKIKDALNLYKMLAPYLPEYESDSDILEFVGTIITNIKNSNEPWILIDIIMLMSVVSLDELKNNETAQNLRLFIDGLVENQIVILKDFCKELGFNG